MNSNSHHRCPPPPIGCAICDEADELTVFVAQPGYLERLPAAEHEATRRVRHLLSLIRVEQIGQRRPLYGMPFLLHRMLDPQESSSS